MSDEIRTAKTPALPDLLPLAARIVSAHVGHNEVTPDALPEIIRSVYAALSGTVELPAPLASPPLPARLDPAVSPQRSVFPTHIVCLEDGKQMQTLKRHLFAYHGLTPEAYRERWDLPPDYPMVAPSYAARRSEIAKKIGFGSKTAAAAEAPGSSPKVKRIAEGVSSKKRWRPRRAG